MSLRGKWIVALPVVALAIAGCGGGGSDSSGSSESTPAAAAKKATTALTKAELIEQGDAICAKTNAALGAINPESPGATAHAAGLYSGMVKSLKDLGNPQETEGEYGEYLRTLGELATIVNELKLAPERDSSSLENAEKTAEGALSAFQLHAGEYGFKECNQGPSAPAASAAGAAGSEGESGGAEAEAVEPEGEIELAPETGAGSTK